MFVLPAKQTLSERLKTPNTVEKLLVKSACFWFIYFRQQVWRFAMMGQLDGGTAKLFYEFSLEEMIPQNHLLRKIDRFLNFDDLRSHLKPFYSHKRACSSASCSGHRMLASILLIKIAFSMWLRSLLASSVTIVRDSLWREAAV